MEAGTSGPRALAACNCFGIRKASRRISQFYDARLAPSGLRATQYALLMLVREAGELSINSLASRLDMDRTTTGQNLRPLERDGLVLLQRSATDGRSRNVVLSRAGMAALEAAIPLWHEAQASFEALNGPGSAADLRRQIAVLRFD